MDRAFGTMLAQPRRLLAARIVLVVAALSPLLYGLAAMYDPEVVAEVARTLSGGEGVLSGDLHYMFRPLGLYVFTFGTVTLLTATDPRRYRPLMSIVAALFVARGVQRYAIGPELNRLYAIPAGPNTWHSLYLVVIGAVIWGLRPRRGG
jgi:hypothetical protein